MNSAEYGILDQVEHRHWYYAGKRELVRAWIQRIRPPGRDDTLLDCGAGTGRFAAEMESRLRVLVLDSHEESLQMLRRRFRPEQILSLSGDQIPLPAGSLEYITALDVLEHVENDAAVVGGFARLLKPGGLAVVTVPASMQLWSQWDVGLHHFRRYERAQLRQLFRGAEWEVVFVNYTNSLAYPAVWAVRKWSDFRRSRGEAPTGPRSEDQLPPAWFNAVLRRVFVGSGLSRFPFPCGVSLILVARRR